MGKRGRGVQKGGGAWRKLHQQNLVGPFLQNFYDKVRDK